MKMSPFVLVRNVPSKRAKKQLVREKSALFIGAKNRHRSERLKRTASFASRLSSAVVTRLLALKATKSVSIERGAISNELREGTFLTRYDTTQFANLTSFDRHE